MLLRRGLMRLVAVSLPGVCAGGGGDVAPRRRGARAAVDVAPRRRLANVAARAAARERSVHRGAGAPPARPLPRARVEDVARERRRVARGGGILGGAGEARVRGRPLLWAEARGRAQGVARADAPVRAAVRGRRGSWRARARPTYEGGGARAPGGTPAPGRIHVTWSDGFRLETPQQMWRRRRAAGAVCSSGAARLGKFESSGVTDSNWRRQRVWKDRTGIREPRSTPLRARSTVRLGAIPESR